MISRGEELALQHQVLSQNMKKGKAMGYFREHPVQDNSLTGRDKAEGKEGYFSECDVIVMLLRRSWKMQTPGATKETMFLKGKERMS